MSGGLERLAGGQGGTFRSGNVVLKPVSNPDEAAWASRLYAELAGPGFRVPQPVRSSAGAWVVDGWCAQEYVEAAHAGPNGGRWAETIAACRAFHRALQGVPRPGFFDTRSDVWAEADRLAFGESAIEPLPPFVAAIRRLEACLRPVDGEAQVIHGDFTANVLFADDRSPCVIDFSPYWRPAPFALAVVVVDAISWTSADPSIVNLCADIPGFPHWLARAALRRVWENDQHTRRGRADAERYLAEYLPVISLVESLTTGA